jgi:3-oxoacyl-[acyl-carrier protein] reductase
MTSHTLLFGASGSLGSYIYRRASDKGQVHPVSSSCQRHMIYFNHKAKRSYENFEHLPKLDAVIWANGANVNDHIGELKGLECLLDANVIYVARSLDWLVANNKLNEGARLCVMSSIWQEVARADKLSYTVSKAALGGLVRSVAADLGPKNIYMNAVLPGPIDNAMTRANLTTEQIEKLGSLVTPEEVWQAIDLLCFKKSCINGQSLVLDHGFSVTRNL